MQKGVLSYINKFKVSLATQKLYLPITASGALYFLLSHFIILPQTFVVST